MATKRSTFKPGDVVKLKSGGPNMTVAQRSILDTATAFPGEENKIRCTWFAGKKLCDGTFDPEQLVPVEEAAEK